MFYCINQTIFTAEADVNLQPPMGMNRKPYMELNTNDLGYPMLPDLADWPKKGMDKKALIQSYVVMAYRK